MRLEARGVSLRYRAREALKEVQLAFEPGEIVGLVGPNGAGKSSLLRALAGLETPSAGEIHLEGRPLAARDRRAIARAIAFLPQSQPVDFDFSVDEVVELGRLPHLGRFRPLTQVDREAVRQAFVDARAESLRSRRLSETSAGERQRVMLARVFAQESPWLLLDEPTANLDLGHAFDLMAVLRARLSSREGGILIAMHDLTLAARVCDRVVVLDQGRVRADAPPLAALEPSLLAEVFGLDARMSEGEGAPTLIVRGSASKE